MFQLLIKLWTDTCLIKWLLHNKITVRHSNPSNYFPLNSQIFSDLILSTQTLMKTWDIWQKPYICRSFSKRGHQIFYSLVTESCLLVYVQVHTLEVFQKELNESEHLVFQAVHSLQRALQGDYRDVVNMKESSRQRLEALREAAIKVSSGHSCRLHQSAVEMIWCMHRVTCNRHLIINEYIYFFPP